MLRLPIMLNISSGYLVTPTVANALLCKVLPLSEP